MTEPVRPLEALVAAMRAIAADNRTCPEVPCQCERAWHADTYEGWADIIDAALIAAGLSEAPAPLPKRDAKQLIESLRIRAAALTGQSWERTANRDMMNEAAQMLEDLTARLAPEVKHSVLAHKYNDRNSCEACHLFWCMSRNQADGVFEPCECTCDLIPLASPAPPKELR